MSELDGKGIWHHHGCFVGQRDDRGVKGWTGVGKLGEKNPEVMVVLKDHHPTEGKGYLLCLGKKLAQSMSEVIKGDPETALDGSVGCRYPVSRLYGLILSGTPALE